MHTHVASTTLSWNRPHVGTRWARPGIAALAALALVSAACDEGTTVARREPTTTAPGDGEHMDGDEHMTFAFGEPASAASADRVVEIHMDEPYAFTPSEIAITPGETITFRVHNRGSRVHDFTLGGTALQDDHEAEMAQMQASMGTVLGHDDPNAVTVDVGETKELTWHFSQVDGVLFGCHLPGHYAGGMWGALVQP